MLDIAPSSSFRPVADAVLATLPMLRASQAGGRLCVAGLRGAARAFFLAQCYRLALQPTLCVLPSQDAAEAFADDVRFFLGGAQGSRVHLYPAWDVPPFEGLSPSNEILAGQIEGLYHLLSTENPILVAPIEALAQRVFPQEELIASIVSVKTGQDIVLSELVDHLVQWGYRRVPLVEEKGEVGVRGGIIDLFPPLADEPLRIEFFGDTVESIRFFDPSSQRSTKQSDEIALLPMRFFSATRLQASRRAVEDVMAESEIPHREQQRIAENLKSGLPFPGAEFLLPYLYSTLESVADYLPSNTLVCMVDPVNGEAALETYSERLAAYAADAKAAERFAPPPTRLFCTERDVAAQLETRRTIALVGLENVDADLAASSLLLTDLKPQPHTKGGERSLAPLAARVTQWQEDGVQVLLVVSNSVQAGHLQHLLLGHELRLPVLSEPKWETETTTLGAAIVVGHLSQGFLLPADRYAFVTEEEIFGEKRHRRRSRPRPVADYLTGLSQLSAGDFVVHVDHGIAKYQGLRHLNVGGMEGDYLHLEYTGGDRLYLPVERINLVQKYTGADGRAPALDRLGGQNWEKTKRKTREAILAMARELLEIHAVRESTERPPVAQLNDDYEEFVARFPFEETSGQRTAIEDVITDLRNDKPMDRLVCGDVGYGKTEVALRAAFLTVQNGQQVALLVPTTILAQQHAETFSRRFADYPMRVELLNRFRSAQEVKTTIQGLASGAVDIVIGTHRLLQRDVVFKNLGLIIIDEEHRFGVTHKEKIKKLRHLVDVLTLSATPIPRTLNMALMGMRDLSVIETPPMDRQAIRTYVSRYDDSLVRSAILNELSRGGQVFFVHNRVETIEKMARQLRELVPEATIVVGHGQMPEHELEKVMLDFLHHRANVLLCSSIIESGLDISTANTIIINRADQFGLAQLYQLRGRVGRSAVRAYAYLLIPGEHLLTEDARKRLEVLQELDDLGSGFRLAAHDLEIRGAGNLLGKEQHGNVAAVGFELYAQMLEETVRELKGGAIQVQIEPDIQIGLPAYIPEAYIPDVNQRLVFYKKLANVADRRDLEDLAYEMEDRFGPLPELVLTFIEVMDLRRVLREYLVAGVYRRADKVTLHFHPDATIKGERLVAFVQKSKGRSQLSPDLRLTFSLKPEEDVMMAVKTLLQTLSEAA